MEICTNFFIEKLWAKLLRHDFPKLCPIFLHETVSVIKCALKLYKLCPLFLCQPVFQRDPVDKSRLNPAKYVYFKAFIPIG